MRRWLVIVSTSLYILGVAAAVPALARARLEAGMWWSVTLGVEAALYLIPMALWFASIKPTSAMTPRERAKRMLIAGSLLFALAFLALTLPVAFLILTGDATSPLRSLVYLGIWLAVTVTSQLRSKKRANKVEEYARTSGFPVDTLRFLDREAS